MSSQIPQATNQDIHNKIEQLNQIISQKGFESDEAGQLADRILDEATSQNDKNAVLSVLVNKWAYHITKLQRRRTVETVRKFKNVIQNQSNSLLWSIYYHMKGVNILYLDNDIEESRNQLQKSISLFLKSVQSNIDPDSLNITFDAAACCFIDYMSTSILSGNVGQAISAAQQLEQLVSTKKTGSLELMQSIQVGWHATVYSAIKQNGKAREILKDLPANISNLTIAQQITAFKVWANIDNGDTKSLLNEINGAIQGFEQSGMVVHRTLLEAIRLTVLVKGKKYDEAIERADEAIEHAENTGDRIGLSGLYRLRSYAKEKLNYAIDDVLSDIDQSIEIASQQGAHLLSLRSAVQRRKVEIAHKLLDRSSHLIEHYLGKVNTVTLISDVEEAETLLLGRAAA